MKEFIMWTALFLMALGTGFILIDWHQVGVVTLLVSIAFCIITGIPYFAKREAERSDYR